jgi:dolichol-phosphate mannosyltransferase
MSTELAVVIPVYNEEAIIAQVLRTWCRELEQLQIDFQILVLNDGSQDHTAEVLNTFRGDSRITILHKENAGHGPTILQGYRQAVDLAPWVFQTDSDNEILPDYFGSFWAVREQYDALFGNRVHRAQALTRRVMTAGSRMAVRLRFGFGGVRDVNVPYRLMRAAMLRPMLEKLPADTFAPNVLLSGGFRRARARILNRPVPYEFRKTGRVSLATLRLFQIAAKSLRQTLSYPV